MTYCVCVRTRQSGKSNTIQGDLLSGFYSISLDYLRLGLVLTSVKQSRSSHKADDVHSI